MSDYRVVLMAYPPDYRSENGSEMTETVNELTDGRWSIRQSASLAVGGLRTRTRHATHGSSRTVWESGARLGLLLYLMMLFAANFTNVFRVSVFDGIHPPIALDIRWLLPLIAILAMMISTRWWVALIVTSIWVQQLWAPATHPAFPSVPFAIRVAVPLLGVVVVAWWLAVATDGRRAVSPASGISLLVATTVVASVVADSVGFEWMMAIGLAVLIVGGLIASTADPRVATTGAVYASLFVPFALGEMYASLFNSSGYVVGSKIIVVVSGIWFGEIWVFLVVFGSAFALAAAASQVGMKRLAHM